MKPTQEIAEKNILFQNSDALLQLFTKTVEYERIDPKIVMNLLVNDLLALTNKLKTDVNNL